ncbi:MAG: BspA family leucine-rich repeat surface protein, partial [Clostridia bacterium]|nr:BspA family leucine-rich repeat surface protein [Clostridia bacterium]
KELLKKGRGAEIFSGSNFDVQKFNNCGQNVDTNSYNSKGITLIALIITIVIMLILAGITINLTLGENGIFQKAKLAKQNYELASAKEKLEMDYASCQMGGTVESTMEEYLLGDLNELEMYNRLPYNPESDAVTAQTTEAAVVVGEKVYCVYLDNILDDTVTNKIKVVLEEDDNVMMADTNASSECGWLGTGISRGEITAITFLDTQLSNETQYPRTVLNQQGEVSGIEVSQGVIEAVSNPFDITSAGHKEKSVMCWKSEDNKVYIWGKGGVTAPFNCTNLFAAINNIEVLDLTYFNIKNVICMGSIFDGCSKLRNIILGTNFNTEKVNSMNCMFARCPLLEGLNLENKFDTSNVVNMNGMFYNCQSLQSLSLGNKFDTSKVKDMRKMFDNCQLLQDLSLGDKFDTSNVKDMGSMFGDCQLLQDLLLGDKFDTSNVKDMGSMFANCISLQNLSLGNKFNTSAVNNMQHMFIDCVNLENLDMGDTFDISNVTTMQGMFARLRKIKIINFGNSNFKLDNEIITTSTFSDTPSINQEFPRTDYEVVVIVKDEDVKDWIFDKGLRTKNNINVIYQNLNGNIIE